MLYSKRLILASIIILLFASMSVAAQQFKMGKNPKNLRPGAILELEDPNRALLLTRVWDPAVSIASPYRGMLVYDSSQNLLKYYNGTGWLALKNSSFIDTSLYSVSSLLQSRRRVGMNGNALAFYGSVDSLVIANTGYIGIGVGNAPISPLHVRGGVRADSLLLMNPKLKGTFSNADSLLMWNANTNQIVAAKPNLFINNKYNIYTNNDILTSDRTLYLNGYDLSFRGAAGYHTFTFSGSNGLTIEANRSPSYVIGLNYFNPANSTTYTYRMMMSYSASTPFKSLFVTNISSGGGLLLL